MFLDLIYDLNSLLNKKSNCNLNDKNDFNNNGNKNNDNKNNNIKMIILHINYNITCNCISENLINLLV